MFTSVPVECPCGWKGWDIEIEVKDNKPCCPKCDGSSLVESALEADEIVNYEEV